MKRWIALIGFTALALAPVVLSQAARQPAGRAIASPATQANVRAQPTTAIDDAAAQLQLLNASKSRMVEAAEKMGQLHAGLNEKITALCNVKNRITDSGAAKAAAELCSASPQANQQTLALQTQVQNESRQFSTLSNVMKAKHDTVKNAINNIR